MNTIRFTEADFNQPTLGSLRQGQAFTTSAHPLKPEPKDLNQLKISYLTTNDILVRMSDAMRYVVDTARTLGDVAHRVTHVENLTPVNPNQVRAMRMSDGQCFVFERTAFAQKLYDLSVVASEIKN